MFLCTGASGCLTLLQRFPLQSKSKCSCSVAFIAGVHLYYSCPVQKNLVIHLLDFWWGSLMLLSFAQDPDTGQSNNGACREPFGYYPGMLKHVLGRFIEYLFLYLIIFFVLTRAAGCWRFFTSCSCYPQISHAGLNCAYG